MVKELKIGEYRSLKRYSWMRIGGCARFLAEVTTVEQAQLAICFAKERSLPWKVIGKGSNLFFDDRGYEGLVLVNKIDYLTQTQNRFCVSSGYSSFALGKITVDKGYGGLRFLYGIPGSVGGAVVMNAGTAAGETFDYLSEVHFLDERGEIASLRKDQIDFGYRYTSFIGSPFFIIEAIFDLPNGLPNEKILQEKEWRTRLFTQPYNQPTLGSTFKNPSGDFAGRLIEKVGLKGYGEGGMRISLQHANFIINEGNGSAAALEKLIYIVKKRVKEEFGIDLELEIQKVSDGR